MSDISSYVTATIARQLPGIQDSVIERNELLKMLKSKGRIKYGLGGDSINWRVYVTEPTVFGSTTDWQARAAQTLQPFVTASVRWVQYDGAITLNNFQLMRNQNAGPEAKMFDQLAEELNTFSQAAVSRIGKHAYNGTGTTYTGDQGTSISGLVDIVTNSGTYATLARATYTTFQSQVGTCSNPELDTDGNDVPELLQSMRSLYINCSGGIGPENEVSDQLATDKAEPDFIVTTKAVYLNYDNCLYGNQRYTNMSSKDPQGNLFFAGVPVKWDTFCPTGKLWMLNTKYLNFDCCTKQLIEAPPDLQAVPVVDRNAAVWKLLSQCQLYSKNPRYHGVLTVS